MTTLRREVKLPKWMVAVPVYVGATFKMILQPLSLVRSDMIYASGVLHHEAMSNPKFVKQLLEVYRQQNGDSLDVNASGPGGYTPLMIAVSKRLSSHESLSLLSRSSSEPSGDFGELVALLPQPTKRRRIMNSVCSISSSSSGIDTSSPGSVHGMSAPLPAIKRYVGDLIHTHSPLNATNDFGQTALHLAAGCSRGDYVEMLLEAGANPNLQDNWGQSSLQAAIGAAAEGAFMVILNHPKANLNLKSDGGITPLMAAVKVVNQFIVKQLLKKSVDIAACDNEGRTAVHWAAVLGNLEALQLLIRQGPDKLKDFQDNKGQTALFLACREGCADCVKHLLYNCANVTLMDNLHRSPVQIAYEKQHHDIFELLEKRQAKQPEEHSKTVVPYPYPIDLQSHQIDQHEQQQHELAASCRGMHATQPAHQTFGELNYGMSSSYNGSSIPLETSHHPTRSIAVQLTLPVSEPMATTSNYTEPTVTLSDIETFNEIIADLEPIPHHTTATAIDPSEVTALQSVNCSQLYTTSVNTTQPSSYPESSSGSTHASGSYHHTVCDCCSQSAPSSALPGFTKLLQHLPIPVDMPDPSQQYTGSILPSNPGTYSHHQNNTTSIGNNSRSPPSYYPSPPSTSTDPHYGELPPIGHPHIAPIDPPSLTPSPESRDELRQCTDQFTTQSYIEGQIQD